MGKELPLSHENEFSLCTEMIDKIKQSKVVPQYITFTQFGCPDIGEDTFFCSDMCKTAVLNLKQSGQTTTHTNQNMYSLEKVFNGDVYVKNGWLAFKERYLFVLNKLD
jgi:hypothetical protein